MSVPTHNLYDFIHQVLEKRFWLLYFYPWGHKGPNCLVDYQTPESLDGINGIPEAFRVANKFFPKDIVTYGRVRSMQPVLLCHDQEPLNFEMYSENTSKEYLEEMFDWQTASLWNIDMTRNLRFKIVDTWQKKWVLLHSERNSKELSNYENTGQYHGAFWWSHAALARDWYRYAEFDPTLKQNKSADKLFLVYCRDVSGTRQYRSMFLEYIDPIHDYCQLGSYNHEPVSSDSSATYNVEDFNNTSISVVLETVFDERIHLTEKTLRPIACGHPFIMGAGPGTLEFLRSYGFKTFSPWIDESYDLEQDTNKRLRMITDEMTRLSKLSAEEKQKVVSECQVIAQNNKQHFFSSGFYNQVITELKDNVIRAHELCGNQVDFRIYKELLAHQANPACQLYHKELYQKLSPYLDSLVQQVNDNNGSFKKYQGHEYSLNNKSETNSHNV